MTNYFIEKDYDKYYKIKSLFDISKNVILNHYGSKHIPEIYKELYNIKID